MKKIVITSLAAITVATTAYAAGENVVASKKYTDDTFQTKISTGNVLFYDNDGDGVYDADDDIQVPGLVAYDPTTGTLSGTKIGILDQETIWDGEGSLSAYNDYNYENGEMDNFVPTVRAVAKDLYSLENYKQYIIPKSGYKGMNGYLAYNTNAASEHNTTSWLSPEVKGTGLVTKTATDGEIGERKIFESTDVANYHAANLNQNEKDIQDISIPTVGAMMTAIQNGSAALIPAGMAGNIVTYTGTAGVVGSVATYDGSTTYAAATDANKIATAAFVETKQKKKVCAGWPDSVAVADRTDANCWLWYFPD